MNPDKQAAGSETPTIPTGTQRSFWCRVLNEGASKPRNRLLVYCNAYIMPLSDSCCDAPECAVPVGDDGDYSWTGWVEESCEQCDTYWTFSGKVLAWFDLPTTDEAFREAASLQSQLDTIRGELEMQTSRVIEREERLEQLYAAWETTKALHEKDLGRLKEARSQLADAQKEVGELKDGLKLIAELANDAPELNMKNYDENQVSMLNDFMTAIHKQCLTLRQRLGLQ